ncbi:MAG: hypothetical protein OJI67_07905 [Prosthecobacter sp.]|nr:hypothetical protein [Prosthecobacter sp.]
MKKYIGLLWLCVAASLHATPSGLNNIPTADTVPHRTVAIQAFSSFGGANQFATGGEGQHSFWMGFKTGWEFGPAHLEWGLDSPLGSEFTGPLLFQTKLGFIPWQDGAFALGVAGVALTDIDRSGDPFTYAMLAHDFGVARLHLGYGLQTNGNSLLAGIDRTWKLLDRDFNLNADLVQTRDQDAWLPSVGAKYGLTDHIVLETWANFPDQGSVSFIAKVNFVFKF